MFRFALFFLAASLLISRTGTALPAQIIIIRHAEKDANHTELSLKGKERAAALVPYLLETPALNAFNEPSAIYASILPKPESSNRAIQTVRPLAEILNLTIQDQFESNDYKRMVEEIKKNTQLNGRTVVICWEHNYIPEIARAFGALQSPATWPTNVFDRTWMITFQPSGKAIFQNFPQRLLYGDSAT